MASVQQRSKNSWTLCVEAGYDANGKRRRFFKTVKATGKREALKLLAEFQTEVVAGQYISPSKMKLEDFSNEWIEKYAKHELSTKTLDIYMRYLKNRILPALGHLKIDDIMPYHVVNFLDTLKRDGSRKDGKNGGLSSGTVHYLHRILNNIFSRAVEWKVLKENPAHGLAPSVKYKKIEAYDEQEIRDLLDRLSDQDPQWQLMILLAITTGLRRGEIVGLEWHHVDFEKGILRVVQSISTSENGQRIISSPKTENSKRKVAVPDGLIELLKEHYTNSKKKRLLLGDAWQGGDHFFVFSNDYGNAFYPETPYLWFRNFLKKNEMRYIRFHDLRHTSATLLINKGVHAKNISARLGHASITTTMNIYGHALQSADKDAADRLNSIIPKKLSSFA